MRKFGTILFFAIAAPIALFAQEDDLRAQIRADLMTDPRSAEMSSAEIDALVSALADKAETDGTASAYLESKNTFDYSSLFPAPKAPSAFAAALTSPMALALAFLLLILLAVGLYIIRRRGTPHEISDIAA